MSNGGMMTSEEVRRSMQETHPCRRCGKPVRIRNSVCYCCELALDRDKQS